MSSTHEDKLWPVATALGACSICATYGGPGVRALALRSCRIFPDLSLLNMSRRPAVVLWDASRREELAAHARQVDVSQCKLHPPPSSLALFLQRGNTIDDGPLRLAQANSECGVHLPRASQRVETLDGMAQ